jgi:tetratricopeptide (TPR) repeat protein
MKKSSKYRLIGLLVLAFLLGSLALVFGVALAQSIQNANVDEAAISLLVAGHVAFEAGEVDRAIQLLNRSVGLRPEWYEAHFKLGTIYATLNKNDLAIASLRIALQCARNKQSGFSEAGAEYDHASIEEQLEALEGTIEEKLPSNL